MDTVARWQLREVGQQAENRRHQPIAGDRRRPLRDVPEISRIEGQRRSAVCLPDTVAIAKTRESALVPVLDDVEPGVPEGLSVVCGQTWVQADDVLRIWRLAIVSCVLEREVRRRVELPVLSFGLLCRIHDRLRGRPGDVPDGNEFLNAAQIDLPAQLDRIPFVRRAFFAAMDAFDEERGLGFNAAVLHLAWNRAPLDCRKVAVEFECEPAVWRNRVSDFEDDEIR